MESLLLTIARRITRLVGLGGRERKVASAAERARASVTMAIRSAIRKIEQQNPSLGHHLGSCVRTGAFCSYVPDPLKPVAWEL